MYSLSVAVPVNPPGAKPVLGREEVWRGLVMKAENALPFVPAMQSCTIIERFEDGLLREVVARGERYTEHVAFTPQVQVFFKRRDEQGRPAGWIANVISDSDLGLLLTFTFNVVIPDVAPGSAEERRRGEELKESYAGAVRATLDAMRKFALEGSRL